MGEVLGEKKPVREVYLVSDRLDKDRNWFLV